MHVVAEVHDIPVSSAKPPVGTAGACMVQLVPFHTSARGRPEPRGPLYEPTATHAAGLVHDTAYRNMGARPSAGTCRRVHAVPFHDSANAWAPSSKLWV